jgi:cytochrome c-type biogenesis protein CcmF
MTSLGTAALAVGFLTTLYAIGSAIYGAVRRERRWVDSSRLAVYGFMGLMVICFLVLEIAFLRNDFAFQTVAEHSSTTTPIFYKMTAMWSSQEGSLLLWAFVLSIGSSAVLYLTRNSQRQVAPWATAVLMGLAAFFCGLMLFSVSPFVRLDPVPVEGAGLTPLLRNPYMAMHPPMIYAGYVLFSIPFAFAIGALITRRLDTTWIRSTRRFALVAWIFLGIGLLLGARWSYEELGWGGYWGWDPVENAALMPWLLGTAFLHGIQVQERRGMLKIWNTGLIAATFVFCLIGTFLVRSGVLQSIHAFGASTVGGPLLVLIGITSLGSTLLIWSRRKDLQPERRISSPLSREAIFLINNLLLVGLTAVIFWGTFFPLISEAVTGVSSSLAAPWFADYVAPLGVLLVLFTGIGPLFAWGQLSGSAALRVLAWPVALAVLTVISLLIFTNVSSSPWALFLFGFAAFTFVALAQEFGRAAITRRALTGESLPVALGSAMARNRRRYGGYTAHFGIVVLLIAVTASSSFQTKEDLRLVPGQSGKVDDYTLSYEKLVVDPNNERIAFNARLAVSKDGERIGTLTPARQYYPTQDPSAGPIGRYFEGEATSEVGLRTSGTGDLWTAFQPDLAPIEEDVEAGNKALADAGPVAQGIAIVAIADAYAADPPAATFRVIWDPLVIWVWIGGIFVVGGALFAVWPTSSSRQRAEVAKAAKAAREASGSTANPGGRS